jgi:hypothetical protein
MHMRYNRHDEHDERQERSDGMDYENRGQPQACRRWKISRGGSGKYYWYKGQSPVADESIPRRHTSVISYFYPATLIIVAVPKDTKVHIASSIEILNNTKGDGLDDGCGENGEEKQCECYKQQNRERRCWPQHDDG